MAVPRLVPPERPLSTLLSDIHDHNAYIVSRAKSSGDPDLDSASWGKTLDEFKSGSLKGPYYSLDDLPFPRALIRLLLRFAIWEMHGESTKHTCRNIDNGLQGGQNSFIGLQYTTRPADIDLIISLIRACMEWFPDSFLRGATSDFKSAYLSLIHI